MSTATTRSPMATPPGAAASGWRRRRWRRFAQPLLELGYLAPRFVTFLFEVRAARDRGVAFLLGRDRGGLRGIALAIRGLARGLRRLAVDLGRRRAGLRGIALAIR